MVPLRPLLIGTLLGSVPVVALAEDTARKPPAASEIPASIAGKSAANLLKQLEATQPNNAGLVSEPIKRAREALVRARGARSSSDSARADIFEAMALEWAETGRETLRAHAVEQQTNAKALKARELALAVERARALLEETQTKQGLLVAELENARKVALHRSDDVKKAERERLHEKSAPAKRKAKKP